MSSGVEIRKLANGLTIACQKIPHFKTVALNVMVKVGSRDENESNNGISHLLEHMAFKGTKKRTAAQIAEEFDNIGGQNNAYTSRENTSYHCKVTDSEWKTALDILGDIVINSNFPEDELRREKLVILQEISENNDSPEDVVSDIFQESAYPGQALGRSILGNAETVKAITREQIFDYMREYYQPANMVLSAAGNIDIDELVKEAEKIFVFAHTLPLPPLKKANYQGNIAIRKKDFEQVHLAIGFEGVDYKHDDYYTQHVLSTLLGGSMSSRLFQEVREKRGLAYSIGTNVSSYEETGTFTINVGTSEEKFREVIQVSFAELAKVMTLVTEEEIERSKKQLISGLMMAAENSSYCADEAAKCLLTHGRYIPNEEVIERINWVTTRNIVSLANRLFHSKMSFAAAGKIENTADLRLDQTILA